MPAVQTRLNKVGNVIKFEGFRKEALAREEVEVTITADMQVGEVLILDAAKYRRLTATDLDSVGSQELAILIDDRIQDDGFTTVGDYDLAVLRGIFAPAIVRYGALNWGAATGDIDTGDIQNGIAILASQLVRVDAFYSQLL